ncbi:putative PUA-like superfamily protein [Helianthus annuus]|nr:putative PUA-like superfamily protein [Helianthus annuus]
MGVYVLLPPQDNLLEEPDHVRDILEDLVKKNKFPVGVYGENEDDEDHGDWFLYTGRCNNGYRSAYELENGFIRFDGAYRIEKYWRKSGTQVGYLNIGLLII